MNTENQELKTMREKHDHHREQFEKWYSWTWIFVCISVVLPPALLLVITFLIKSLRYLKVVKALQKECLLKSYKETDNTGYTKLYQYMISQKTFFG